MKILEKFTLPDGTDIQLEDWKMHNTENYPNLYGYTIGAYPIAKNSGKYGLVVAGETFRLTISINRFSGYTNDDVLSDWEALKNGNKTLLDLSEHYRSGDEDRFYIGLINKYQMV